VVRKVCSGIESKPKCYIYTFLGTITADGKMAADITRAEPRVISGPAWLLLSLLMKM